MKLKNRVNVANKLSTKLMSFLPILKVGSEELFDKVKEELKDVYVEVKRKNTFMNANSDEIEALSISKESMYEMLLSQIDSKYFPTQKSKDIALEIIKEINSNGFFEGDEEEIAKKLNVEKNFVKKIRERFMFLEPSGVGAKDLKEALLFQLYNVDDIKREVFELAKEIIENLEEVDKFSQRRYFKEALFLIRGFNFAPSIEFGEKEEIIPEIVVINRNGELEITLNDEVYPEIVIDDKKALLKEDLKKVRNMIDAMEMRKSTLKKIALMIVEFQYDFFQGGALKPLRIQDIAQELEYNASTISRAVANKYLLCDRGMFELKYFFSTGLDEDVSANQIKEDIKEIIKNEDKNRPLSDDKITEIIKKKYNISIVRRTISKYRESLNIPTSRERKRLYKRLSEQ